MADEVLAYVANYHPLLGHLMQQTGILPLLSTLLDDDAEEYAVDAGTVLAGMIHNILSPEPIRLYRLPSFWQDKALPLYPLNNPGNGGRRPPMSLLSGGL